MEMRQAFLVFPHQLFEVNFSLSKNFTFYLIEEPLFFTQYNFHKQKLIFHRASMKYYEEHLIQRGFKTHYFNFIELVDTSVIQSKLKGDNVSEVHYYNLTDDWLETKVRKEYTHGIKNAKHESPMFLCTDEILETEFNDKEHFSMSSFYISQRKKLNLLLKDNKPKGGKWSFDSENRKKLPKSIALPEVYQPPSNKFELEAMLYIKEYFSDNIGNIQSFRYAVTHQDARQCLIDFLLNRIEFFGTYEDAISIEHSDLFHSLLSPYLNSGLLTPEDILIELTNIVEEKSIPLNSLEGFIRQIIGWREFMRAVYVFKGRAIRTTNFWNHDRKLPSSFYTGTTGIEPFDNVVRKVLERSYSHHIERLMVLGNFMQLCEINPNEIYKWFMEMYIDAYDWVMVPNVYSMSQYADGGLATTKPYISSSNYIIKMSDFKRENWGDIWDALYWRFIDKHKDFFSKNPRLSLMVVHLKKMPPGQLKEHYKIAGEFLKNLH